MRPLVPVFLLLMLTGCAMFSGPQPLVTDAQRVQPSNGAVVIPRPAQPQELASGFVDAMSRGDLAQARAYYLSSDEFDKLFDWEGGDPRQARDAQIMSALQAAAPALAGARFQGLVTPPGEPKASLKPGQKLSGLVVKEPAAVLDNITAVAAVGPQRRLVRLEGLVRIGDYWRLFSPTLVVQ